MKTIEVPFTVKGEHYLFKVLKDGEVMFYQTYGKEMRDSMGYELSPVRKTNTSGNPVAVYKKVVQLLVKYIKEYSPSVLSFSYEDERYIIYEKVANMLHKHGYKHVNYNNKISLYKS